MASKDFWNVAIAALILDAGKQLCTCTEGAN
jgi:hypothetical protein